MNFYGKIENNVPIMILTCQNKSGEKTIDTVYHSGNSGCISDEITDIFTSLPKFCNVVVFFHFMMVVILGKSRKT